MGTWMQRMIAWIKAVRIKNGFFTPAEVNDEITNPQLNVRDYRLYQLGLAMMKVRTACEKARKGTEQEYADALFEASDFLQDLYIGDTGLDGEYEVTNREALIGKLALVCTEACEAMEAAQNGDMKNLAEEFADTYIRMNDMVGELRIDIEDTIYKKMQVNEAREPKHGKLTNL